MSRRNFLPSFTASCLGVAFVATFAPILQVPAQAADDSPTISVVIDGLTPVVPKEKSVLRISGRAVNISGETLNDVTVQLHISDGPIGLRSLVADIVSAGLYDPIDGRTRRVLGTRELISPSMAPGQQQSFMISVPMVDLQLGEAGAFALSIEVLGVLPRTDTSQTRKGIRRTFLPWYPRGSVPTPLTITWLWPLADAPARNAEGVLLNDQTPEDLAPGGRLTNLVDIGSAFPEVVNWVVDPQLLQTVSSMTTGYLVQRAGTTVVGDNSVGASQWLESLKKAISPQGANGLRSAPLAVVPYADIDALGARRAGLSESVAEAIDIAPAITLSILDSKVDGTIFWAPKGRIDKETAGLLTSHGIRTVVLTSPLDSTSDNGMHPDTATLSTPSGALRAVMIDPVLSGLMSSAKLSQNDVVGNRQRFLVETGIIATSGQTTGVVVAPNDLRWVPNSNLVSALLRATTKAPWLRSEALGKLIAGASATREKTNYGEILRRGELPPEYLQQVVRLENRLSLFTSILDDPISVSLPYSQALLRSQSSAWRGDLTTGKTILKQTNAALQEQIGKVRALTSGTIIFSGDAGRVPITLTNELTQTVTVGLHLVGSPSIRLESAPITDIVIEPGHRVSVEVDARVIGSDSLQVKVQLLTQRGEPYGTANTVSLTSTAYSRAAAWVVGLAFSAIIVFVVVGVFRRIAKGRAVENPRQPPDVESSD